MIWKCINVPYYLLSSFSQNIDLFFTKCNWFINYFLLTTVSTIGNLPSLAVFRSLLQMQKIQTTAIVNRDPVATVEISTGFTCAVPAEIH